jgi:hypothetical protein
MSLSNPQIKNPCTKFIQFKADDGHFEYWDKELNEGKGGKVIVELPIRFIVLDQLSTIKGFCKADESGFVSNEVHNLKTKLNVRSFGGNFKAVGEYNDIKDEIKAAGGKFCKSVYVCLKGTGFELANFQFLGASLGPWIEFANKADFNNCGVEIAKEMATGKTGKIEYKMPVFKRLKLSPDQIKIAMDMDKSLQDYFKHYESKEIEEKEVKEEKQSTDFEKIHQESFGKSDVSNVKDMPWDDKNVKEDAF